MISSNIGDLQEASALEYFGLAKLLRLSLSGTDLTPILSSLLEQLAEDENMAYPLLDAAIIFQFRGDLDIALELQRTALRVQRLYRVPSSQPARLRLLALMAPGDLMANVPIECLLENSDVELSMFYTTGDEDELMELPEHDALFVAISETEANRPLLAPWFTRLADWPKPVINNPLHIERVARNIASQLLHPAPGVVMPPTLRMSDAELRHIAQELPMGGCFPEGLDFPLIIRPLDSHAGHHLYKVGDPAELLEKLDLMSSEEFFVSRYIDYRSSDGLFRKFRIILIDGKPFACHMAVSSHWVIHYLNAGMVESAEKRAEEALFMANFEHEFAVRHGEALSEINRRIGLDYLGIDCAETQDGQLLIFEIDHAMIVHDMDPADLFPYKQAPMQKLFAAFRTMLIDRAEQGAPATQ